MKTDTQLQHDISAELAWDPSINPAHVGISVSDGVAILSGHLASFAEKEAVERAVQRVAGVRAVAVELDVKLEPHHQRSDAEIAAAISTAFKWHALIPDERLQVKVEKGWVMVSGEVDWEHQRHNAETVVQSVTGVVGLTNHITLHKRDVPTHVARRIQDALAGARRLERGQRDRGGGVTRLRTGRAGRPRRRSARSAEAGR